MANQYSTRYQEGFRFGYLTVVTLLESGINRTKRYYLCKCECGKEKRIRSDHIADGAVISCGCRAAERSRDRMLKHGHNPGSGETPTYSSWLSMRRRCLTESAKGFRYWGGKGITICKRWDDFSNFLADMGERPAGTTLDRFPNNKGNYEPGNCRWATRRQQAENKTTTIRLTYADKELTLKEWSHLLGIKHKTIWSRWKKGWVTENILRNGNAKSWAAPR